jgi:hypothetical protein
MIRIPGYFDEAFALVDEVYHLMSLQLEDSELVRPSTPPQESLRWKSRR